MPPKSSSSAGATYLDKARRIEEVREAAQRAASRVPSIRRVILFGSLASGTPTPRSDADLLVIVANSPHAEPRDRVPEILRALVPLPCPVDLLVLTSEEFDRSGEAGLALGRTIRETGIDLL